MTADTNHRKAIFPAMKKSFAALLLAVLLIVSTPHAASATSGPGKIDEDAHYDARVQGYNPDMELPGGSNGLSWFLLLAMAVACVSVIFKDAKRSHLD